MNNHSNLPPGVSNNEVERQAGVLVVPKDATHTAPNEPIVCGGNMRESQGVPDTVILLAEARSDLNAQRRMADDYASALRYTREYMRSQWVGEKAAVAIIYIDDVLAAPTPPPWRGKEI